jgi:hypothetical protein
MVGRGPRDRVARRCLWGGHWRFGGAAAGGGPRASAGTGSARSLSDAFAALKIAPEPCQECQPLVITGARPSTARIETTHGPSTAPSWEFALRGTSVIVTRIAVDLETSVTVVPPPWNPNHAPIGISIERATRSPDGMTLSVGFTGAPDTGDKACGADYTAEAVESETAVVVIVAAHGGAHGAGGCLMVGATREATADLAKPLEGRPVLEVQEGRPVPVVVGP